MSESCEVPEFGRHGTAYHTALGAMDVSPGPQPKDGICFTVSGAPTEGTMMVEYTHEQLAEVWEDVLFESPVHADEVLG